MPLLAGDLLTDTGPSGAPVSTVAHHLAASNDQLAALMSSVARGVPAIDVRGLDRAAGISLQTIPEPRIAQCDFDDFIARSREVRRQMDQAG